MDRTNTTIQYFDKILLYNNTFDDIDEAQAMIDYFRNKGKEAACTHNGDNHHLYVEVA